MNYQDMFLEYSKLMSEKNSTQEQERQNEIQTRINQIINELLTCRDKLISEGNLDPDFFGRLDGYEGLSTVISQEKKEEEQEPKYDLSTNYIVSALTGEEISLVGYSLSAKIELLYEHTSILASPNDKVITSKRDASFERFMSNISKYGGKDHFIKLYGSNWKEEVEKRYKESYENAINNHIQHIAYNVSERLQAKANNIEEKNEKLTIEVENLKQEIKNLMEKISTLNKDHIDELTQLRQSLVETIKGNQLQDGKVFEFSQEEKDKILKALDIKLNKNEEGVQRLEVEPGKNIEVVARQLMICDKLNINVSAEFNGKNLSSKDASVDSIYMQVFGKTKEEYDIEIKRVKSQIEDERSEAKKNIPNWIETGKSLIFSERHEEWEKLVVDSANDLYNGKTISASLEIMTALENGASVEDAKQILSKQGHSGNSLEIVRNTLFKFSNRGPEFWEATAYGEINENTKKIIEAKKQENIQLAQNHEQSMGAHK